MRLALLPRWASLMFDYGLKPTDLADFTMDEINEILKHQNARWDAVKKQNEAVKAQQRRRR